MTSTQRSESINHSLKINYVNKKQNLHAFVKGINRLVHARAQTEKEATMLCRVWIFTPKPRYTKNAFVPPDVTTVNQSLLAQKKDNTLTLYGFETPMAEVYTRSVYSELRERIKISTLFRVKETE